MALWSPEEDSEEKMVKIRLKRVGKRKQPSYRVVVADSRSPRDGRIIESIGHYQPRQEPSEIVIDVERARYWLSQGAQPSDSVRKLLQISGAVDGGVASPPPAAPARRATPAASVAATPAGEVAEKSATPSAGLETVAEEAARAQTGPVEQDEGAEEERSGS
jgi:small subunit ribosomal protein S16